MVSPGSAKMVHLHSPLMPRPPAPPPVPVPGDSPLGKSKLEMSPLEPLKVPPHVSSAASHQRAKPPGRERRDTQFLGYLTSISQHDHHASFRRHPVAYPDIHFNLRAMTVWFSYWYFPSIHPFSVPAYQQSAHPIDIPSSNIRR